MARLVCVGLDDSLLLYFFFSVLSARGHRGEEEEDDRVQRIKEDDVVHTPKLVDFFT